MRHLAPSRRGQDAHESLHLRKTPCVGAARGRGAPRRRSVAYWSVPGARAKRSLLPCEGRPAPVRHEIVAAPQRKPLRTGASHRAGKPLTRVCTCDPPRCRCGARSQSRRSGGPLRTGVPTRRGKMLMRVRTSGPSRCRYGARWRSCRSGGPLRTGAFRKAGDDAPESSHTRNLPLEVRRVVVAAPQRTPISRRSVPRGVGKNPALEAAAVKRPHLRKLTNRDVRPPLSSRAGPVLPRALNPRHLVSRHARDRRRAAPGPLASW